MRKAYTFRSTRTMDSYMNEIMNGWDLDRTSVIKLALYLFAIHAHHSRRRKLDLWEIVHELEELAPADFPAYADFAD